MPVARFVACLLGAALAGAACSSEKEVPVPAPRSTLRWTVNEAPYAAVDVTGEASTAGGLGLYGGLRDGDVNRSVQFFVPERPGTYPVAAAGTVRALYQVTTAANDVTANASYPATSGTVVVSTYAPSPTIGESHAVGTFSFSGARSGGSGTATVTAGVFDVYF